MTNESFKIIIFIIIYHWVLKVHFRSVLVNRRTDVALIRGVLSCERVLASTRQKFHIPATKFLANAREHLLCCTPVTGVTTAIPWNMAQTIFTFEFGVLPPATGADILMRYEKQRVGSLTEPNCNNTLSFKVLSRVCW